MFQSDPPRFSGLGCVGRPDDDQIGYGSQCRQVFHWLVSGPILSQSNAVVGEDVDHWQSHQRRQPNGRAHVVGEDEESTAVGDDPAVQRHTVQDSAHGVFAHTEMDVAPVEASRLQPVVFLQFRIVGGGEIGRTPDQGGQRRRNGIQHLA